MKAMRGAIYYDVLEVNKTKTAVAVMPRPEFRPFLERANADTDVCQEV